MDALESVPWDHSIDQRFLNIDDRVRTNLFPWNGQFSPQLVEVLLREFGTKGGRVVDPFMGSGTVLVESAQLGMQAFGADVNPAPFKLASVYRLINLQVAEREVALDAFESDLNQAFPGSGLFSSASPTHPGGVRSALVSLAEQQVTDATKLLAEALIVLVDFHKPQLDVDRVFKVWRSLRSKVAALPYSKKTIAVANADARYLPLRANSSSLVLTSPPYINVFNYHQQFRRSVEALGWDLLSVARSEIGSNRKHRGNRFLTVIQYCLDMSLALAEMKRVCRPSARMIIILGRESQVRKTPFLNGDIVVRLALQCSGLKAICRQERVFTNRFGKDIYEDILHFSPNSDGVVDESSPREVALQVLEQSRRTAPDESKADLDDAIDRIDSVSISPKYQTRACTNATEPDSIANAAS